MKNDVPQHRLFHYFIITGLVIISYLPTFTGDFIFDDQTLVKNNNYITELHSLSSYLDQEDGIPDPRDKGRIHTGYYRPLINFTYFLDYNLWGMNAAGFRTTNLILHLLTAFILYELIFFSCGEGAAALLGAVIFAVHPVQTEAVAVIVSRNNLLATLFILSTVFGYLRWWKSGSPLALLCSLIAFIGAMFSKEFGVMTIPILFLAQRCLISDHNLRREIESYIPFLILAALYFLIRKMAIAAPLAVPADIAMRLLFTPYLIAYNLKLIFLPSGLHSFNVGYPDSLTSPASIASLLLMIFIAALCRALRKERVFLFSLGAFMLALLPVLNLFAKPSVSLIAMRWLYLPISFLSIGFAWGYLMIGAKQKRMAHALLSVIVVFFVGYSYILNLHLWHDEGTLLLQEVHHFHNDRHEADYAEIMLKERNYQEAEEYFLRSLKKYPHNARTYINYSALLLDTKRPGYSVVALEKARFLAMAHRERLDWHNNMGVALTHMGRYDEAYQYLWQSLAMEADNHLVRRNLAALLAIQGKTVEAKQLLDEPKPLVREKH